MIRFFVTLFLVWTVSNASETLKIKKGWQLVGVPIALDVREHFNNENVAIVWAYDALQQAWSGYAPDEATNAKVIEQYTSLQTLEVFSAIWVFSLNDWNLKYTQESTQDIPKNNTINLEIGWNLISIPQNIVVSDKIFDDAIVWKYDADNEWSVNNSELNFPPIEAIKQSEGLWVKSEESLRINIDAKSASLVNFTSQESMLEYIRNMMDINNNAYYYNDFIALDDAAIVEAAGAPASDASTTKNATTTNLQEIGVDESDILKHDNVHIFSVDNTNKKIIITSFENIANGEYTPINSIEFAEKNIIAIYLQDSRLSVISNKTYNYIYEDKAVVAFDTQLVPSYKNDFVLDVFDVSDINSIVKLATHTIDGSYRDSRLINGELFLISQFQASREYENSDVISESLVPTITSNNQDPQDLLVPENFYAPIKLDQYVNITTLSRFTISTGTYKNNSSFLGNVDTYYASDKSFYLVSSEYPLFYNFRDYKEQQMIYKFTLDSSLSYAGRGVVEGRMLNQFSMSEKDDYLRVATTSGWSWFNGGETNNEVYSLSMKDKELVIEDKLTGLGKDGETIKAVRFMEDRGYVVTFRQTDPLYTLDLSDPKELKVVGELSIPGFSSYLHVIDVNRVLSIGRNADADGRAQELQFQLFDVSDFTNPTLADKIQIGTQRSYSEAEYNHKAFSYRANDLMFGVPYRNYSEVDYQSSEHFGVYQVNGLSIQELKTLSSDASDWGNVGRGLIFDLNSSSYGALLKGSNILCETIE